MLRDDYTASSSTDILANWYGVGVGNDAAGAALASSTILKVCGAGWMQGEGKCCQWTVPAGITKAKFQLWGGGYGSNPGCCCGGSPGGMSGAYAEATVTVAAGQQYTVCAGCSCSVRHCSNQSPGYGCMSWVTGPTVCCLKADGIYCYNDNCQSMNCMRQCMGYGTCWYYMQPYCTNSGSCWCSYSEYCFGNSCATCGVVPAYASCWDGSGGNFCSCICTNANIKSGQTEGHKSTVGSGCYDTNNYGYHTRGPIIDADTGLLFPDSTGCRCLNFSSSSCGGCNSSTWTTHPGLGGHPTHVMGGCNTMRGDYGKAGMVQISYK